MNNRFKLSRFKKRKKTNYTKSLFLIAILLLILYFYSNSESIMQIFIGE